jgi:uncharacterized membrane protein
MLTALWHMACSSKMAAVLTVSVAGKFLTAEGGFAVASVTSFLVPPDVEFYLSPLFLFLNFLSHCTNVVVRDSLPKNRAPFVPMHLTLR